MVKVYFWKLWAFFSQTNLVTLAASLVFNGSYLSTRPGWRCCRRAVDEAAWEPGRRSRSSDHRGPPSETRYGRWSGGSNPGPRVARRPRGLRVRGRNMLWQSGDAPWPNGHLNRDPFWKWRRRFPVGFRQQRPIPKFAPRGKLGP
jgi:hypothetical protein